MLHCKGGLAYVGCVERIATQHRNFPRQVEVELEATLQRWMNFELESRGVEVRFTDLKTDIQAGALPLLRCFHFFLLGDTQCIFPELKFFLGLDFELASTITVCAVYLLTESDT